MIKRFFCIALCLCMLLGIAIIPSYADNALKDANFYIEEPVVGAKPSYEITTDRSDVFKITDVRWTGEFDSNGCFIGKNEYRVYFSIRVKDGVDVTIPDSSSLNVRNYRLNGGSLTVGPVLNDGKVFNASKPFFPEFPAVELDTDVIYSKEDADSCNWENKYKLFVVKSYADSVKIYRDYDYSYNGLYKDDEVDRITSVIVDTAENVDAGFMEELLNLTEVWLSSDVDAIKFLNSFEESGPEFQTMYAWEDHAAKTWDFKLYVPVESLPNGLKDLSVIFPRHLWFETVLYSGDVYDAYSKKHSGQDVSIPWCTNHQYTKAITTADRVMIEKDCYNSRWFCYSCAYCGKPENNINHIFSHDSTNPPVVLTDSTGRMLHDYQTQASNVIKASNYLGRNSNGDYVYMKSCKNCGISFYADYTLEDYKTHTNLNFHENYGSQFSYEELVSSMVMAWNQAMVPSALQVTPDVEFPHAFAVSAAPVSATFSAWAENELNWAKQNGLLDEQLLGNNYKNTITRLQFCSLAVKLAENLLGHEIEPAASGTFTDTDNIYVRKAFAAGITTGTGNGLFSPSATLNRQQMATFIYRALMYVRDNSGIRYTVYDSQLKNYTDSNKIASWATESMAFMNALGLVKGTTATTLAPTANCTIEQAILVAYRSLSADEIGWYQVLRSTDGNVNGASRETEPTWHYLATYINEGNDNLTQVSIESGSRIWVTDVIELPGDNVSGGAYDWLVTTHPYFPDRVTYARAMHFKPIKDLSAEDLALYNSGK